MAREGNPPQLEKEEYSPSMFKCLREKMPVYQILTPFLTYDLKYCKDLILFTHQPILTPEAERVTSQTIFMPSCHRAMGQSPKPRLWLRLTGQPPKRSSCQRTKGRPPMPCKDWHSCHPSQDHPRGYTKSLQSHYHEETDRASSQANLMRESDELTCKATV